jgi:hypothetical protein
MSSSKHSEYWTEEHLKFTEEVAVKLKRGDRKTKDQLTTSLGFCLLREGEDMFTSSCNS